MAVVQNSESGFAPRLAVLSAQFASRLGSTLDELNHKVTGQGPSVPRELLEEIHSELHKLAGAGDTFGFSELSRQARALKVTAIGWLDNAAAISDADWQVWCDGLLALRETLTPSAPVSKVVPVARALPVPDQQARLRIVLIENDVGQGKELVNGLRQFGYEVVHFSDVESAETAILANPPDVLVIDITPRDQLPVDGPQVVPPMFAKLGDSLPVIFLTERTEFTARIAAAQAGAGALLSKPVSVPGMAESIEMLVRERKQTPYRVLIVDDNETLAEHYRLALAAAGMLAEKVSRPHEVLEVMQYLRPDLLLLDLHMPECTGAELARAIRYDQTWQSMPIIYLSAESELKQRIKAMNNGADEFLLKPISDVHLVASVRARAARARTVSELMSQDSLTGLLKHASIKERLVQEVDRASRQGQVMSVAMIDIDFFKKVNDTWGHPEGDQVIKTLGHLLRHCLRRQDSVGRYGGEEFLAVLPECPAADAVGLLDNIRLRFGLMGFVHDEQSFSVTLSVGVASTEQYSDAQSLLAAADAMLYAAKHGGRNQVRSAQANQETSP